MFADSTSCYNQYDRLGEDIMKSKQRQSKPQRIAQFEAEARELAGSPSANQVRFLRVAKEKGEELEPVGPLAGSPESRGV